MAEDLRDILAGTGDSTFDIFSSMEGQWDDFYDAAFVAAPLAELTEDPRVARLQRTATRIVAIDGNLPAETYRENGFFALSQPFSTEDVRALLRDMDLLPRSR